MLARHLPKAKDDTARAAKPAPQNWENQESMEMFLIHHCSCGHPCMPSKGEINENCHVTCKCPPHKTKTNKNQDFKEKSICTTFLEGNPAIYKTSCKKSQILTQEPQFLEVYSAYSKEATCAKHFSNSIVKVITQ